MVSAFPLGGKPWSNIMEILEEKDGVDTELLVYAMTLVNKVCFLGYHNWDRKALVFLAV